MYKVTLCNKCRKKLVYNVYLIFWVVLFDLLSTKTSLKLIPFIQPKDCITLQDKNVAISSWCIPCSCFSAIRDVRL